MSLVGCLGCGTLCAPGPRCPSCQYKRDAQYNATRPAHHALYRTNAWKQLSIEIRRQSTRCTWCLKPLPFSKRVADHVEPIELRPDLALEPTNIVVACSACNTRRGRNWKLPDPDAPAPEPTSVSDRMAAIFGDAA